jgi:EAL domain-containing protein (putative c-di-GMP-specific phosphodiesterase class I)
MIASVVGLIVVATVIISNGVTDGFLTSELQTTILTFGTMIVAILIAITVVSCLRSKFIHGRRFNEDIFATDRGVFSEKMFVESISKRVARYNGQAAVIAFSIFELKKMVLNMFGYRMVAKIAGSISSTLINRYQGKEHRDIIYGFDYNENFLLFLPFDKSTDEVIEEINKLNEAIQSMILQNGLNMDVNIFYGVYIHNNPNLSSYEMIRRSLIAADFGIRNKVKINQFEEYMLDANQTDLTLSNELSAAIDRKELEIFYQPKFDIKLNRFFGAEALIRWNHPTRGLLYPSSFIPFAERSDLITRIDRYVIRQVMEDIASWKEKSKRLLTVSVNLSRRSLYQSDLMDFVNETIKATTANPLLMEFELTESTASRDLLFVSAMMKRFKNIGIKVSIDDFGTGYSSLSYLKKMPFDTMKIDKSFFDDIEVDKKARDVVKAMIDVALALNVYVVAEGIQTAKQVALLKQMGCHAIQGFYYSHSLARDKYEEFLQNNKFEGDKAL